MRPARNGCPSPSWTTPRRLPRWPDEYHAHDRLAAVQDHWYAGGQTGLWVVVRQFVGNGDNWTASGIYLCGACLQQGNDPKSGYATSTTCRAASLPCSSTASPFPLPALKTKIGRFRRAAVRHHRKHAERPPTPEERGPQIDRRDAPHRRRGATANLASGNLDSTAGSDGLCFSGCSQCHVHPEGGQQSKAPSPARAPKQKGSPPFAIRQ
jgi:hypothetical protein